MEGQGHQVDTTIIDYDNLPAAPELNEELLSTLDKHIKGHWTGSFQCITMIRSICKAHPKFIPDIFTKYGPAIFDFFNHTTMVLIKNVLKLLMEVFSQGGEVNLEDCVHAYLPLLVKKAAMDSGQTIREMCQQILTIIATKCCYCNTIEITTRISCDDKNSQMAEVSIKLLAGILSSLSNSLTQINTDTLQVIMRGMYFLINGKRNTMKTSALDICLFIYNQIGSENYLQLMNYSLQEQEVASMGQAMETHRTQKVKPPQFSEVLKQHKAQRQSGAWGGQGHNLR